jgi:hypothetical protein
MAERATADSQMEAAIDLAVKLQEYITKQLQREDLKPEEAAMLFQTAIRMRLEITQLKANIELARQQALRPQLVR